MHRWCDLLARRRIVIPSRTRLLTLLAAIVVLAPGALRAQERRRMPALSGPPPNGSDAGIPRQSTGLPKQPYVGTWEGSLLMKPQAGETGAPIPIVMLFDIADTT